MKRRRESEEEEERRADRLLLSNNGRAVSPSCTDRPHFAGTVPEEAELEASPFFFPFLLNFACDRRK